MAFPENLPTQNNNGVAIINALRELYNVTSANQLQNGDIVESSTSGFGSVEAASSNLASQLTTWKTTYTTVVIICSGITISSGDFGYYVIALTT